jgi:subtilisin family serine protease
MSHLGLVNLTALMEHTSGRPEVVIGLLDGPVAIGQPFLESGNIREIFGGMHPERAQPAEFACLHGTFVAGILGAKRGSGAPAICPNCTLLVRPIFTAGQVDGLDKISVTPDELAVAIRDSINAKACIVNLSVASAQTSYESQYELELALTYAAKRGVIVVAAAGNQGSIASSVITRHPWVIPVVAFDLQGRPTAESNLAHSIGRRGLGAPGENVTSLGPDGGQITFSGTSAAVPFVTGAIALLWSQFPTATAADIKLAVTQTFTKRRSSIVPPLLDAWAAYQLLMATFERNYADGNG